MSKEKKDKKEKASKSSSSKKSHKRKDERHHKHSKASTRDKKASSSDKSKEHKHDRKKSRKNADAIEPDRVTEEITTDDFFRLSEEFRVWLHFAKKRSMDEMSSDEARELFGDFVTLWNGRQLSMMYYDGIPSEIREACIKTKHKWGISLSEQEKAQLVDTTEEVERKTRRRTEGAWNHMAPPPVIMRGNMCVPISASSAVLDRESQKETERSNTKSLRAVQKDHFDDIAPKETGHDAIRDKRKGVSSTIHGSAVDKEMARDGLDMSEKDTFGGGDDFASVKARMERGREIRDSKRMDRLIELQDKERIRAAQALDMLGIDFTKGEKITIAPRHDT